LPLWQKELALRWHIKDNQTSEEDFEETGRSAPTGDPFSRVPDGMVLQ
jgi:hypothetical protein